MFEKCSNRQRLCSKRSENSNLSSYQIAFNYSITKSVVGRLCRQHLGSEIYNKRESLSFDYLASQIKGLRQKKYYDNQTFPTMITE